MSFPSSSGTYLHVGQHSAAWALGLMTCCELFEATVTSLPSLQHLQCGVQQFGRVGYRFALQRVPDFPDGFIGTLGRIALWALLHRSVSAALASHSKWLLFWYYGFTPAISLESVMFTNHFIDSQTFICIKVTF